VTLCTPEWINRRLAQAGRVWLFTDYDGTLAGFAPTPEHVNPEPAVVALLSRLVGHPRIRVAVISGRRLSHVETLVPVPSVLLAGTYGVEVRTPEGERVDRVDYDLIRPVLDAIRPGWLRLTADRQGFFLEDKGWSLALHARFADGGEAKTVLAEARRTAMAVIASGSGLFRVMGGHKFLEVGPKLAHKGRTVAYLLARFPWPRALPLYLGDDDKDEEAFGVVKARDGIAVLIAPEPRETEADWRLESPRAAREWLGTLAGTLDACGEGVTSSDAVYPPDAVYPRLRGDN